MSLALLYNIPNDRRSMDEWSFSNRESHDAIIQAIQQQFGRTLPTYVLDPLPDEDIPSFLSRHQQMHTDMAAITGIATNNYTALDFQDASLLSYYFNLHASEHVLTHQKLGI